MDLFNSSETLVVLDFETTGMYPEQGDRVIEIGAVLLRDNQIADRFQSLVNPGFMITREIETITGINNAMLAEAPPAEEVLAQFVKFIDTHPLAAHNVAFDQKFLEAELERIGKKRPLNFACTLQVARRLYADVINYKLETLARYKGLPVDAQLHRALADAELAAQLWLQLQSDLKTEFGFAQVDFELMKKIGKMKRENAAEELRREAEASRSQPLERTGNLFG